jgi:hypothetical protein
MPFVAPSRLAAASGGYTVVPAKAGTHIPAFDALLAKDSEHFSTSSFPVLGGGDGKFAHFIFANLNGTISAWDPGSPVLSPGSTAIVQTTGATGTRYTGLAINRAQTRLYAASLQHGCIVACARRFGPQRRGSLGPAAINPNS